MYDHPCGACFARAKRRHYSPVAFDDLLSARHISRRGDHPFRVLVNDKALRLFGIGPIRATNELAVHGPIRVGHPVPLGGRIAISKLEPQLRADLQRPGDAVVCFDDTGRYRGGDDAGGAILSRARRVNLNELNVTD